MTRCAWIAAAAAALALPAQAGAVQEATAAAPAPATPPEAAAFHADIGRIYPNDRAEIERRGGVVRVAAEIDGIWKRVEADPAAYLPLLRAELARGDNPAFFYMDGAHLLRRISRERADGELALATLARIPWPVLNRADYLADLIAFANDGYDTGEAALRWLALPADEPVIVQPFPHVFSYDGIEAMVFSLFPMEEQRFVGRLIARLGTAEADHEVSRLLHCIWATVTPEGRAALRAFAADERRPAEARRYVREMLVHRGDGPMPTMSEAELRQARRAALANPFSHGSFERFHALTDQLVMIAPAGDAVPAPPAKDSRRR
jgi:hypothetical protein